MTHKDKVNQSTAFESDHLELFTLVSKKLHEAIEDTISTHAKLSATLDVLEKRKSILDL